MENVNMTIVNETEYTSTTFTANGKPFVVVEAKGRNNYVTVARDVFMGNYGKQFRNWDEAISHYKSADMKVGLLRAKLGV